MTTPDLEDATWRKSSRSSPNGSDCVEVAELATGLAVRDSKDPAGSKLLFGRGAWSAFVAGLRG
ncbi:DUF397 domain-containing protein [Micromonospora sp. Llam7]|uniref:DUF397 domain-containing protein n=1 Tax=Micromonospora tarapacensis TaxID=2835305 RepID=UPI001C82F5BB|nr:DUF397 domain-containing protein [Micromonospora tarapacensis]MBX7266052.1 DUF397 domain-containing protein [Micromonospora tarapacensis]